MSRKVKRLVWIAAAGAIAGMVMAMPLMTIGNLALALGLLIGARVGSDGVR